MSGSVSQFQAALEQWEGEALRTPAHASPLTRHHERHEVPHPSEQGTSTSTSDASTAPHIQPVAPKEAKRSVNSMLKALSTFQRPRPHPKPVAAVASRKFARPESSMAPHEFTRYSVGVEPPTVPKRIKPTGAVLIQALVRGHQTRLRFKTQHLPRVVQLRAATVAFRTSEMEYLKQISSASAVLTPNRDMSLTPFVLAATEAITAALAVVSTDLVRLTEVMVAKLGSVLSLGQTPGPFWQKALPALLHSLIRFSSLLHVSMARYVSVVDCAYDALHEYQLRGGPVKEIERALKVIDAPTAHLQSYVKFLQHVLERLPFSGSIHFEAVCRTLDQIQSICLLEERRKAKARKRAATATKDWEAHCQVVEVQKRFVDYPHMPLAIASRKLLLQGPLVKKHAKGPRVFFLFNDIILESKPVGKLNQVHFKSQQPIGCVIVETKTDTSFMLVSPQERVLLTASSSEEKNKWVSALTHAIGRALGQSEGTGSTSAGGGGGGDGDGDEEEFVTAPESAGSRADRPRRPTEVYWQHQLHVGTLHSAAMTNQLGAARSLLEPAPESGRQPADVNAVDDDNSTALHIACNTGHIAVARILLEHSANACLRDGHGRTPLHLAAASGYLQIVQILLAHDVSLVNQPNSRLQTPLFLAARHGHLDCVRELVDVGGSDVTDIDEAGNTVVIAAVEARSVPVLEFLLEHLRHKHPVDHTGVTPLDVGDALHVAAYFGFHDIVHCLLSYGVDPNMPRAGASAHGETALLCALKGNNCKTKSGGSTIDTILALLAGGAHVNKPDHLREYPLLFAVRSDQLEAAVVLAENGARPLLLGPNGITADDLMDTAWTGPMERAFVEYKRRLPQPNAIVFPIPFATAVIPKAEQANCHLCSTPFSSESQGTLGSVFGDSSVRKDSISSKIGRVGTRLVSETPGAVKHAVATRGSGLVANVLSLPSAMANLVVGRPFRCKRCGQVVCTYCSEKQHAMPPLGFRKPVRVCDSCFTLLWWGNQPDEIKLALVHEKEKLSLELQAQQQRISNIEKDEEDKRKKEKALRDELEAKKHELESLKDQSTCGICFDAPKNALVVPCGHVGTCMACAQRLMQSRQRCPVCRTEITNVIKAFIT